MVDPAAVMMMSPTLAVLPMRRRSTSLPAPAATVLSSEDRLEILTKYEEVSLEDEGRKNTKEVPLRNIIIRPFIHSGNHQPVFTDGNPELVSGVLYEAQS